MKASIVYRSYGIKKYHKKKNMDAYRVSSFELSIDDILQDITSFKNKTIYDDIDFLDSVIEDPKNFNPIEFIDDPDKDITKHLFTFSIELYFNSRMAECQSQVGFSDYRTVEFIRQEGIRKLVLERLKKYHDKTFNIFN